MRNFQHAKLMARTLKSALDDRQLPINYTEALEIVAAQFGMRDWNLLAAKVGEAEQSDGIRFDEAIPILRIFDEAKAREFYLGFLGFKLDWEHRFGDNFPIYMQVSRADLRLHLSEHHGDASPGSRTFIPMHGVEALHKELSAANYSYMKPGIEAPPWGREITVTDPFSNRLTFCELGKDANGSA